MNPTIEPAAPAPVAPVRGRGFGIVEVLAAASVLLIATSALVRMQSVAANGTGAADRAVTATYLAESRLQYLASLSYYLETATVREGTRTAYQAGITAGQITVNADGAEISPTATTGYQITWAILDIGDQAREGAAKRIDVQVSYRDPMALTGRRTIRLDPYIFIAEYL